ncbi:hypothetical protein BT93_A1091 [Corymbia citriodora subsp. variegata]|nr:hypothetical protein BT93_A1091 [Corymbia citriodora subsp. variegata]
MRRKVGREQDRMLLHVASMQTWKVVVVDEDWVKTWSDSITWKRSGKSSCGLSTRECACDATLMEVQNWKRKAQTTSIEPLSFPAKL